MQPNYYTAARQALLEKDPDIFTIDMVKHEENMAELRADRDKSTPPPSKVDLRKEFDSLRQCLFSLKQNAHCFETRTIEAASRIKLCEQNIDNLLRLKQEANEAGNLRGVRTYERGVEQAESALADATDEFTKNKRWSGQAARVLKAFDGHARIEELRAILETPSPTK